LAKNPASQIDDAAPAVAVQQPPTAPVMDQALAPTKTYCSREICNMDREANGELEAFYVQNNGEPQSGRFLIGLKNIFAKCLPNMPKTYIIRLIFDRRHRSVVMVRNGNRVIGGITYRPFQERRFAEIAFCAIAQTVQVSGFGTRLMNWTKHYARLYDNCDYFLTYADNAAVGYFSKQGFTKHLTMPREQWHGFIKDYDGGTLMEGFIHPSLPFTDLPGMISAQRTALDSAVRQYTTAHVVHRGLTRWKEALEATAEAKDKRDKNEGARPAPVPLADIPGVKEAGWTEALYAVGSPVYQLVLGSSGDEGLVAPTRENLTALQLQLLDKLEAEKDLIWPFLEPVDPAVVPDYYELVKDPIDMRTIRRRVDGGNTYITMDIFTADVQRMFSNAKFYNSADTPYYKAANKLAGVFSTWVSQAVQYEVPK